MRPGSSQLSVGVTAAKDEREMAWSGRRMLCSAAARISNWNSKTNRDSP
ncbi:MAG: hypothetical protein IJ600_07780 [Lachnospiraceae bacterium]|nr:hypothetical protein [Lachnospiraceae bacterium]